MIYKLPYEEITFTNTSTFTEPVSWLWKFGDGMESTEKEPTHSYPDEGVYDVSLSATDKCGLCETAAQQVNISAEPPSIPETDWEAILPVAAGALGLMLLLKKI